MVESDIPSHAPMASRLRRLKPEAAGAALAERFF
jgi:hypothetical protein